MIPAETTVPVIIRLSVVHEESVLILNNNNYYSKNILMVKDNKLVLFFIFNTYKIHFYFEINAFVLVLYCFCGMQHRHIYKKNFRTLFFLQYKRFI